MPDLKAILFDLDGTLIDSIADIANSGNRMLEELGHPTHEQDAYLHFIGDGAKALVERALPKAEAEDQDSLSAALKLYLDIYAEHWHDETRPYEGISEALTHFSERGIKLAVLSNKPHVSTQACAEQFFPAGTFDVVFGQREGIPHKPAPDGALEILSELGLEPADCAYVGDSGVDMQTAKSGGLLAVAALWGFRSEKELRSNGGQVFLQSPHDLTELS